MSPRVKRFFSFYKPYLKVYSLVLILALLFTGVTLLFPLLAKEITQAAMELPADVARISILRTGAIMLVLSVVYSVANHYFGYLGHAVGASMEADMRRQLFGHLQKMPYSFYDSHRVGGLLSRITSDLLSLSEVFHHGPEDLIQYVLRFAITFFILFRLNAKLTLGIALFLPPIALYVYLFNKRLHAASLSTKTRISEVNAQVEDTLSGIRVVQSFTGEAEEQMKFLRENAAFLESRKRFYKTESVLWEGASGMIRVAESAAVVLAALQVTGGTLSVPELLAFVLYVGYLVDPIRRFIGFSSMYQEGITGFERFLEIMSITPSIADAPGAKILQEVQGDIRFENVSFRYGEDGDYVLRDISVYIRAGEYVALVGPSGAGKTTFCSLVPRFYDVTSGAVQVDGQDIRHVTLSSLRGAIGVVQQDVYLFSGTALDNIRYGRPGATDEEVFEAARKAGAHDFIVSLPQGYHSDLGPRGVRLSGGQRQRISIARMFLKNPPILILDEATSSLDTESERQVQQALEALSKGRTTLVIAHRLSTIRAARRILVLTKNGIEEEGDHQILMEKGGVYAALYRISESVR